MNSGIIIILGGAGFCPSTVVPWFFLYFCFSQKLEKYSNKILTIWALRWRLVTRTLHQPPQTSIRCPLSIDAIILSFRFSPWSRPYDLISTMRVAGEIVEQQGRGRDGWNVQEYGRVVSQYDYNTYCEIMQVFLHHFWIWGLRSQKTVFGELYITFNFWG